MPISPYIRSLRNQVGHQRRLHYSNGDESQYVIIAIGCTVIGGTAKPDHDETVELRYCSESEAANRPLTPWLSAHLRMVYAGVDGPGFEPSTWRPPSAAVS